MTLKVKEISGKTVCLLPFPVVEARKLQVKLFSKLLPLAGLFKSDGAEKAEKSVGTGAIIAIADALSDGTLDHLIDIASRYIHINGEPMDESKHFTTDELLALYEVLWFFLYETYGGFFAGIRSRFPNMSESMKSLSNQT